MWGLLNAVAAPVKSAAYQFARNQAAAAARNAGLNTVRAFRRSPINSPEEGLAALKLTANLPVVRQGAGALGGVAAVDLSNRTGFTGQIEGALNQVGPGIDRFFSGTPQAIQQFGREQEKKGWGGALEWATPLGFLAAPFIPNTAAAKPQTPMQRAKVGQPMVLGGRLGYKAADGSWQPRGDMESENIPQYVQGKGYVYDKSPVTTLPPEERAYNAEKDRIAQLTGQDPELQRYENARKAAKTQEEMNAARDIGMAIWARSNPKLAAKVKPGQSGYEVIQNELNAGQMGPVMDLPFDTTKPFSPTPIPPEQQSVTYEGVRPAMLGEVTPIVGGGFPTQQASSFERFRQAIASTAPTFQGSPLGTGSPLVGNLAYTGSVAPLGAAVEGGDFRSEQAQKLAEMFKKAQFQS